MLLPSEIEGLLREDAPVQDLTCRVLGVRRQPAHLTVLAREAGVASGLEAAAELFAYLGAEVETRVDEGEAILPGAALLVARGGAAALHRGARQAQELIGRLSGVASTTRRLVETAQQLNPELIVSLPRPGFPDAGRLVAQAVLAGGGQPGAGLSGGIEVGREHWQFVGGIEGLLPHMARLKRAAGGKPLTLVADSAAEALRLASAEPDFLELPALPLPGLAELCKALYRLSPRTRRVCRVAAADPHWLRYVACGLDGLIVPDLALARPLPVAAKWSVAHPMSLGLGWADSIVPVGAGRGGPETGPTPVPDSGAFPVSYSSLAW